MLSSVLVQEDGAGAVEIFYTNYAAIADDVGDSEHDANMLLSALRRAAVPDSMPFILLADGTYETRLNEFLRSLPRHRVRSPASWKSYATDLLTWARFLGESRGKTVWQATANDVAAYFQVRRGALSPYDLNLLASQVRRHGRAQIAATSWNRSVAVLSKLYQWAYREGHVAEIPFTYQHSTRYMGEGLAVAVERNDAREPGARHGNMQFVSLDDYVFFRDVGLCGRLPNGAEDPIFRGRNAARNAAFAQCLVTTGLRLTEASSLITNEIPALPKDPADTEPSIRSVSLRVAAAIAKGRRARTVPLPVSVLRLLHDYLAIERANAVTRARDRGTYLRHAQRVLVRQMAHRSDVVTIGQHGAVRLGVAHMPPRVRRAALLCDESGSPREPLALWLTEHGTPIAPDTWETTFAEASARCRRFGRDLEVTPHMLRHTFAIYMLAQLIKAKVGSLFAPETDDDTARKAAYRRIAFDPLQELRNYLGHASITTTFIYLDSLVDANDLVDDAVARHARACDLLMAEQAGTQVGAYE